MSRETYLWQLFLGSLAGIGMTLMSGAYLHAEGPRWVQFGHGAPLWISAGTIAFAFAVMAIAFGIALGTEMCRRFTIEDREEEYKKRR